MVWNRSTFIQYPERKFSVFVKCFAVCWLMRQLALVTGYTGLPGHKLLWSIVADSEADQTLCDLPYMYMHTVLVVVFNLAI